MPQSAPPAQFSGRTPAWSALLALLKALRPRQWVKNALVYLPFIFAIDLAWSPEDLNAVAGILLRVTEAALAFCALSGGVYLLNDLMDLPNDRKHPVKRFRPLAAGQVKPTAAVLAMASLLIVGAGALFRLSPLLGGIGALYIILNLLYSLGAKRIVIVDVLLVASGYVIRAVAGAIVIGVLPSPWLYTTTGAAALFIVLGKRFSEVRLAGDSAEAQRAVLRHYPPPFIAQLTVATAAITLVAYALYAVEAANLPDNHTMLLTIPLVVFGVFRFLYLLHTSSEAEYPELLIVRDGPMLLSVIAWVAVSSAVLLLNS